MENENKNCGFVPTPPALVEILVSKAFAYQPPSPLAEDKKWLLDPGAGEGNITIGVIDWCIERNLPIPNLHCVEIDPGRTRSLESNLKAATDFSTDWLVDNDDFLFSNHDEEEKSYAWVIANPPYVSVARMPVAMKSQLRKKFNSAAGRFDLYMVFVEQSIRRLSHGNGVAVFVIPDGFLTLDAGRKLRQWIMSEEASCSVMEIERLDPNIFPGILVRPVLFIVRRQISIGLDLPKDGSPWPTEKEENLPSLLGEKIMTLSDVCCRISCGPVTGADEIFVVPFKEINDHRPWMAPTLSGQQLTALPPYRITDISAFCSDAIVLPYDEEGQLMKESGLPGDLRNLLHLDDPIVRERLARRPFIQKSGLPIHSFNERPSLVHLRKPKILCKRICKANRQQFWLDVEGKIVPRHSVFYLVPKDGVDLMDLWQWVIASSECIGAWIRKNAATADREFVSLQKRVLAKAPLLISK